MEQRYDAIVIGAGNGGLAAGATLAKSGKKVCLLERHNIPGGCGTSFRRGRFEFEVALHQLSAVGTVEDPGPTMQIFNALGIMDKLDISIIDSLYRVVLPGKLDVTMPTDVEEAIACLSERFPQYADNIRDFYKLAFGLMKEGLSITSAKPEDATAENFPLYFKYAMKTSQEVLDDFFPDKELQLCLNGYWFFMGVSPAILPFYILALCIGIYMKYKPQYPVGGSQMISQALADVIRENGGTLRFNCGAKRILLENGKAVGVETENGDKLFANVVVSNISPTATYFDLLDPDDVPAGADEILRPFKPGISVFTCFFGLDCPPEELGITESMNVFYESDDVNGVFEHARLAPITDDPIAMTCYTVDDPRCSPEGTSVVSALCFKYGKPWIEMDPEVYHEAKYASANRILERLEAHYPGLRDHIEELEVATPLTHMRYLKTPDGCVYGYEQDLHSTGPFYPKQSLIPNLEFAGGFVGNCGFGPNYLLGFNTANEILRKYMKEGA
ncbi:NAD(P)/FAD-dependent oxidoreductase [Ruminococcaceae bacterium OttesenSCG-928-L11]|nr:NAD(P)/FAD-dependent oxidoreductase [Ruminococcaceae bacterium OttesenSCG-928-L11]